MIWDDKQVVAFDVETSGTLPEYALQPWRAATGDFWVTSMSIIRMVDGRLVADGSKLAPTPADIRAFLQRAIDNDWIVLAWFATFDISVCAAMGCADLIHKVRWVDGMLFWKHGTVEPEYDMDRSKKKSYSLKAAVPEFLPIEHHGYEKDIDFHDDSPEARAKLLKYNDLDAVYSWIIGKNSWDALAPTQQRAAAIEAECLSMVAQANLDGMPVDMLVAAELSAKLEKTAAELLVKLSPHGVTEAIVRSPTKLAKLMFDDWGLPVLKENTGAKTGKVSRATDKEVLHELAFADPRCADLRGYREALGNRTKFADTPLISARYNGDGRTRPSGIVFGTYCVPGNVEVLTRGGWIALQVWGGGDIAQVRPDLSIEFLPATRFAGPITDEWVRIKHRRMDCDFTPGHTIPYLKQKTFEWATTKAAMLAHGFGETKYIPVAGVAALHGRYSSDQMRLFAAVQADGYFRHSDGYFKGLVFTLKKERKMSRLRLLLGHLGLRWREYTCEAYADRTEFHIVKSNLPAWLTEDKKVFGPWVLDTNTLGLSAFVEEIEHWDGSPHLDGGYRYTSSIVENVAWVVTAAALAGRKASQHEQNVDDMYSCHISDESTRAHVSVVPRRDVTNVREPKQAFCATTQTGFWLARSNGKIFVTGNTGRLTYGSNQGKGVNTKQTGFALHQEKRGRDFRSIIAAPPGYTLMEVDAAGQEFRWMAILANDQTMMQLCLPGEDAHSFMAASIIGQDYRELVTAVKAEDKNAEQNRYLGKVANLCIAEGTTILTDRGPRNIEHVRIDDKVWDGENFVSHGGLSFSGIRQVISYMGVTATPHHKVLLCDDYGNERWETIEAAARHGWKIKPAMGSRWSHRCWSAVRIVDGIIRRTLYENQSALRFGAMWLRQGARCELAVLGDRPIHTMQGLRDARTTPTAGTFYGQDTARQTTEITSARMVSAVPQSERQVVSQLRRTWDRVSVLFGARGCELYSRVSTTPRLLETGSRPDQQRRSLRAWKLALGYKAGEPCQSRQVRTYDIVNCGPNTRFAANGLIVHNSLQYRTYPKTFRKVARVQYNIPMELPEAQRIHTTYKRTYTQVPRYWDQQIRKTRSLGYVETLAGRRVKVVGNWDGSQSWKMESTSLNYPVQGTGGDQKYLAMKVIKPYLLSIGGRFAWDLHDGIYMFIPDAMVERAAVEIRRLLDNLPYRESWGFDPPIPLPWDVKTGTLWGNLKEVKS